MNNNKFTICFYEYPAAKAEIDFWENSKDIKERLLCKEFLPCIEDENSNIAYVLDRGLYNLELLLALNKKYIKLYSAEFCLKYSIEKINRKYRYDFNINKNFIFNKSLLFGKFEIEELDCIISYIKDIKKLFHKKK